jgi:hypothetical protein
LAKFQTDCKENTAELKRYETTVSFMSRQLDEEKLKMLEKQVVEAENRKLQDTVSLKEELIDKLYRQYVDCPKSS